MPAESPASPQPSEGAPTSPPAVASGDANHDVSDDTSQVEELQGGLSAPQFGLKEMFAFMGFVAIGLVGLQVLDPMISAGLLLLGLCIFAHVAGNAMGMKLQDGRPTQRAEASKPLQSSDYAPVTRLSLHQRLGKMTLVFTVLGAVLGAVGGGGLLAVVNWTHATIANISLAALSCSVLGGLFGFWLSSFLQVFLQAWAEAHRNADPDRR